MLNWISSCLEVTHSCDLNEGIRIPSFVPVLVLVPHNHSQQHQLMALLLSTQQGIQ